MLVFLVHAVVAAAMMVPQDTLSPTYPISRAEILCLEGRDHHAAYEFAEALESYDRALEIAKDSTVISNVRKERTLSANGQNMSEFCYRPVVVARERFSEQDFFLYYPLKDFSWMPTPNSLDTLGGRFSRAIYFPSDATRLYYSAPTDSSNCIKEIHISDSLWTSPQTMDFTSGKGEIYPLESNRCLYFSSKGLFGVGGYDLYRCEWDPAKGDWGEPENLGFPYSSPADDFLFYNTPDGRYVIFASNRGCPDGYVDVYVLEYDILPVSQAIKSPEELRALCALSPAGEVKKAAAASPVQDKALASYVSKVKALRSLRDSLARHNREIEAMRNLYSRAEGQEKQVIGNEISRMEISLPALQKKLAAASKDLQALEMDFLSRGIVPERPFEEEPEEKQAAPAGYTFEKHSYRNHQ